MVYKAANMSAPTNLTLASNNLTSSQMRPRYTFDRQKYYWYPQNAKKLWCYPIIHFSNIAIAILDFFIAQCKVIAHNLSFLISVVFFFSLWLSLKFSLLCYFLQSPLIA